MLFDILFIEIPRKCVGLQQSGEVAEDENLCSMEEREDCSNGIQSENAKIAGLGHEDDGATTAGTGHHQLRTRDCGVGCDR